MPGVHDFALFVASGILLNLTPGADTLYIVTRATTLGRKAGAVAAARQAMGSLTDPLEVSILTDAQVRSWTERHYSGGWDQFLVDVAQS